MNVDSYTVTISSPGHDSANIPNVVVFGDETDSVGTVALTTQLKTIAKVTSRSSASAFQPTQTIDSYTVNQAQVLQTTGKANATNEANVLLSVPGVTLTNAGTVTIRGGAAYEVGYQYDGVTFKEPFLGNNGSNGLVNGLGSVQIVEGAGDATQGGVGAGVINVIPNRGVGPPRLNVDFELGGPSFYHQFAADYGFSTPNDRFSEYVSFTGQRLAPYLGYHTTDVIEAGNFFATQNQSNDQFLNNFIYKFGTNNHESLQFLYTIITQVGLQGTTGGPGNVYYPYDTTGLASGCGTQFLFGCDNLNQTITGWTASQYAQLVGLQPGVPSTNEPLPGPQQNFSNNTNFLKFEYDNRLNSTSYFDLRYYNYQDLQAADVSYSNGAWNTLIPGSFQSNVTGGTTSGFSGDFVHQFGANLTVSFEAQYNILRPQFDAWAPADGMLATTNAIVPIGLSTNPIVSTDWLAGGWFCGGGGANFDCSDGASTTRTPTWGIHYNGTVFQNWGAGLRAQYNPSDKLKFDVGLRDEGQNQHWYSQLDSLGLGVPSTGFQVEGLSASQMSAFPNCSLTNFTACPSAPVNNPYDVGAAQWNNNVLHPTELQPRVSINYQLNRENSLRFGYGRSAVFATAQTAGTPFQFWGLENYVHVPAKTGSVCGWVSTLVFPCANAAEQLYWQGDNIEAPDAGNGVPATYNNWDLSWYHQFHNGYGFRLTPFIKVGTSLPSFFILNPALGIFAVGNNGYNKTSGIEMNITTPQRSLGLSGFFSATYQNVLSTTPPFTLAETTVPILPLASLKLGDLYRAGYVSPFSIRVGAVENMKNGWSVSPQLQFDIGYPYSVGNLIAAQLSDGSYSNIPQVNFGPGITGGLTSLIGSNPGSAVSTNYYDPAYPGSALNPNISATRGTPATAANGGELSHSNALLDLSIQKKWGPNTIGVQFQNLFGNAFVNSVPAINPYYQPVANGISGPQTYTSVCGGQVGVGNRGCGASIPRDINAFTNGAYILTNGNFTTTTTLAPLTPFNVLVYFQRAI